MQTVTFMSKWVLSRFAAVACGVSACFLGFMHPLGPFAVVGLLICYALLLWRWPHAWIPVLIGGLPLLDLSPWTGWVYVQEFDLAVLTTLAVGYWRLPGASTTIRLPLAAVIALTALTISYIVSAVVPLIGVGPVALSTLGTYHTPFNSLRVLKGFAAALALAPLMIRAVDASGGTSRSGWYGAMSVGVALAAAVVLWERLAFPGLLNFSTDYRTTGSFFEMHVGGAALDGYLALGLPFLVVALITGKSALRIGWAAVLFGLGTYAVAATFARGLYAAYVISLALIGLLYLSSRPRSEQGIHPLVAGVAAIVGAIIMLRVFSNGGYRALVAVAGMYTAAFFFGAGCRPTTDRRIVWGGMAVCVGISILFQQFIPKGPYVIYALSVIAFAVAAAVQWIARREIPEPLTITFAWVGVNAILVAWHWGGDGAGADAALAVAVAAVASGYNRWSGMRLWKVTPTAISIGLVGGLAIAVTVPAMGNYFMKGRFGAITQDLGTRENHWKDTLIIAEQGKSYGPFGRGLGTFPERYFWGNARGEVPGVLLYIRQGEEAFARLGGPRTPIGYGETLRFGQRMQGLPEDHVTLTVDLRTSVRKVRLVAQMCEKWLIYQGPCAEGVGNFDVNSDRWVRYEAKFDTRSLAATHWWGRRPVQVFFYTEQPGAVVDIDNVRLTSPSGHDLVRNGEFTDGVAHWFFSSDHHHLPWHAKDLWLGIWFDQGWFGLAAFVAFTGLALLGSLRGSLAGNPASIAVFAALVGFLVVGLFDSLIDTTRIATVFYLLCLVAILDNDATATHAKRGKPPSSFVPNLV